MATWQETIEEMKKDEDDILKVWICWTLSIVIFYTQAFIWQVQMIWFFVFGMLVCYYVFKHTALEYIQKNWD